MLEGTGTLVTGGKIPDEKSTGVSPNTKRPNFGGTKIEAAAAAGVGEVAEVGHAADAAG